MNYKSFVSTSPPKDFDYNTSSYKNRGYRIRARIDKYNPDKDKLLDNLKEKDIPFIIVNHQKRKRMIDVWIKEDYSFFTTEELAEKLRVNIMTIYRYIDSGKLKAYKIGKEFRIDKREFSSFLDNVKTK